MVQRTDPVGNNNPATAPAINPEYSDIATKAPVTITEGSIRRMAWTRSGSDHTEGVQSIRARCHDDSAR